MGQAAVRVWLHRARPALLLAAALSCDAKGTDYFLSPESTKQVGDLTGLVSVGTTPLNGAAITLTGPESRSTTTGSTGTYAFADLTPGTYTVTAAATNFSCPPGSAIIVAFQTTTRNIACTPQPGTVNGTVRRDLAPLAGVTVTARQGTNTVGTTTTAGDGTYTIPNLLPGAYTIAMTPPPNTICPITERPVSVSSNLTITADFDCTTAPGSVTGTVRVDGAGQSGVTVTLTQGATTIGTATTGAGGTYTIADVPPGVYTASITPPAGTVCVANSQSVTVQANAAATADFDCTIPRGAVTGVVRVNAVGQSGVAVTLQQGATTIGSATTGAGGAYTISNVQPGTYTVTITPPVGTTCTTNPQQVTVPANQAAVANFDCTPQPGTVSGTVRLDLAPLAGVTITARQGTNTVGTTTTASDGTYTIPNLPPGAYTIAMTPPSNTVCPITQRNVTVQSNVTTTADFDCTTAPGSVAGTVRVDGAGQSGVTVTLAQGATTIGTATTGASGTYTIANVPPGGYTASITPPAGTVCVANSQNVTVQANAGATADFDCTIPRGAVTGVVRVNSVGQSGVAVTLKQGSTTIGSATTGTGGAYTISNVQPGTYTATITTPLGATCSTNPQQVTVQSSQTAVANFDCINFAVTLTNPSPSYRQISGTSYETCTGITTTPAQPGGTWTATWTGTDTVGGTTRTGTLSGTGTAIDRQPITFSGTSTTYTVNVTVTSAGATRSATGTVTVDTTAGTCPP